MACCRAGCSSTPRRRPAPSASGLRTPNAPLTSTHGMPPSLRGLLHRAIHHVAVARHAPWQASRSALPSAGRRTTMPALWPPRAPLGLPVFASSRRHVRHQPGTSNVVVEPSRAPHSAKPDPAMTPDLGDRITTHYPAPQNLGHASGEPTRASSAPLKSGHQR